MKFFENFEELAVYPRGYRILSKVPRMPNSIVEKLVKSFKSFQHILVAEIKELNKVDGIGEVRAQTIIQSLFFYIFYIKFFLCQLIAFCVFSIFI